MLGVTFALLAATCWGVGAILVRLGLETLRPTTGVWTSMIPGIIIVVTLALIFNLDDITSLAAIAFLWFALGGFFNFALGRFFNTLGIQLAGVARATPLFSTAPFFATILAIVFLGETITPWLLAGTATIVSGIILITSERLN